MSSGDLARTRKTASELLARARTLDSADYPRAALGNLAVLAVDNALLGCILGLEEAARTVLEKYSGWLACGEVSGPAYLAVVCARTRDLTAWLLEGDHSAVLLRTAVELEERRWSGRPNDDELADFLRDCFIAGDLGRASAACVRFGDEHARSATAADTELDFARWACVSRRDGTWSAADHVAGGERMLRRQLEPWLEEAQGVRAASWLRMVYEAGGTARHPCAVLAKARVLLAPLDGFRMTSRDGPH